MACILMMYSCRVDLVGYSVLATAWCTGIHDGSATGNKIICHNRTLENNGNILDNHGYPYI